MSVTAVLSVNMVTASMLLSVFFVSGALAACPQRSGLFITAPHKMEALSGSCLLIPCTFRAKSEQEFDNSREIFGVWIKSDSNFGPNQNNVIFNSRRTDNIYPMRFTGNLREKNCTTLFSSLTTSYTHTYYFRVENWPFKATAICDPLQITVQDSPPSPRIEISGDLKEKESVSITCSAFTPCPHSPPKLTWNLQQDSHNKIQENTDGTFTTKIQKTITLSDQHDGYNITCSVTYPVNEGKHVKTAEQRKTLSVSYAPKDTSVSISPSGLVSAGSWVNLTCSSRAKPPVSRFTWFKISKDGPMTVSEGPFYSVNVTDVEDYYCVATNDLGNQTSSVIHLGEEPSNGSLQQILGGLFGLIMLICLVVCVCFLRWRWLKSTDSTQQPNQSLTGEELTVYGPTIKTEEEEGNIHYGEIDFSKRRPEPSPSSVQDSGQQQNTLYAQVQVSKTANSLTQTAECPEDLYAQVKKK
ncbi:vascular cell adhesion protein 1-like isoform X2 [Larimichthys crocea]|uniref:vascular cell adhesion protein 1-like isoform X2 n=1 Tax=Larimichthys crocea TaxID=215358 RepID=UPI000F5F650F|nr:vascular cell adhesion protein 1-like isoform X2 [Larimichthys crocea]